MYDRSGAGTDLRKHIFASFAFWHTMKMGFFAIWRSFANEFLAGLFHQLYPQYIFKKKPTFLTSLVSVLTTVRIAYRIFGPILKQAMAERDKPRSVKVALRNLRDLCEFYIPTVRFSDTHTLVCGEVSEFNCVPCVVNLVFLDKLEITTESCKLAPIINN
jgi:hypothetical protein